MLFLCSWRDIGVFGENSFACFPAGIDRDSYDDCPAGIVSPAILKAGKSSKTQPFSYDDCPAGIVSPAILKAGKSSKTQPFFNVS